jgi:phosphatidate cytidylyltransferase
MTNNTRLRTFSGALFVAVLTASIVVSEYTAFAALTAITILALQEFYSITVKNSNLTVRLVGIAIAIMLLSFSFLYFKDIVSSKVFLLLIPCITSIFIIKLYSKKETPFNTIVYIVIGLIYIALPMAACIGIMFLLNENLTYSYSPLILLGFFILLWSNDTFAYIIGITFGKHKLFERISPKKSWEGFFGGLICTVLLSLLIAKLFTVLHVQHWIAIAAIVVVFGVYGDLIESMLKRSLNIKDSGRFLPGHGGILDRFDAVLIAAPMVYFYLRMFVL